MFPSAVAPKVAFAFEEDLEVFEYKLECSLVVHGHIIVNVVKHFVHPTARGKTAEHHMLRVL